MYLAKVYVHFRLQLTSIAQENNVCPIASPAIIEVSAQKTSKERGQQPPPLGVPLVTKQVTSRGNNIVLKQLSLITLESCVDPGQLATASSNI